MTDPKKTEAVETAKGEMAETELSDPALDGVAGGLRHHLRHGLEHGRWGEGCR